MDELLTQTIMAVAAGTICSISYMIYSHELQKYESKKDFWKDKTQNAITGPKGIILLVGWNIILILAIPTGIIKRILRWKTKNLKN